MRRIALLSLGLAGLLALAACGSSGRSTTTSTVPAQSPSPAAFSSAALTKTDKTSLHVVFTGSVKVSGQRIGLTGSGDVDPATHTGTTDVGIALGTQRLPLNEILDGNDLYVSSSFFSTFLPSGKKWLKSSLSSAAKTFGASTFALVSPGIVPALEHVQKVGSATIGGTQTTEYTGRVDVAKLPESARAALGPGKVTFGPVDVWIGGDGYVHRARVDLSSSTGGTQARVQLTTTLSNFGEKVSVTVPPASETVDASKLKLPGLGGLGL